MLLKNQQCSAFFTHLFSTALCSLFCLSLNSAHASDYPDLDADQLDWLGQQIFRNECASELSCLVFWSPNEAFPSLGIGHFIWYRSDQHEIFDESFPELLHYLEAQGFSLPDWIAETDYAAPWQNREEFLAQQDSPQVQELRDLLASSMSQQTAFIVRRFEQALNKILAASSAGERDAISEKFYAVANTHPPYGLYALIDYVNFKGEGVAAEERYADQGWGLLQVLEGMQTDQQPLPAFVDSARLRLQSRVHNAPPERNEQQWLPGWNRRLDTYLPPGLIREN